MYSNSIRCGAAYCYRRSVVGVCVCACVRACVRVCVCVSIMLDTNVSPAKTAEPTEMPFGLWTRVRPSHHLWAGMPPEEGTILGDVSEREYVE